MEDKFTDNGNPYLAKIIDAWPYLKPWQRYIIFVKVMWYSTVAYLLKIMNKQS